MNFLLKVTASVLLTATFSISVQAQTLKSAISQEVANNVKFLNLESEKAFIQDSEYLDYEPMQFSLLNQRIAVMKDVNTDGINDAIVLLSYCEKTSCHPTTNSTDLVVLKGLGKNQFKRLGSASLGVNAKINNVNKGIINLTSYEYGDDDPGCCATKETKRNFKIKNSQLVEVGYLNRISN